MSHLPADFHRRLECGTALPSAPSGEPAAIDYMRVQAIADDLGLSYNELSRAIRHYLRAATAQAAPAPQAATTAPAPLPAALLVRDIANDLGVKPLIVCKALETIGYGRHSVNMAVTADMARELTRHFGAAPLLSNGLTPSETVATASVAGLADWTKPTTVQQRMSDAVTLLCAGKRPPDDMVAGWLDRDAEDGRLQEFAIEHGPAWCQGIALLDAAQAMVDQPTEGVAHEHAEPQAARATPPAAHKEQP